MIALVDYGTGNLSSVANALDRLAAPFAIVGTAEALAEARSMILPGVGAAAPAMAALRERGLDVPIRQAIARGVPFLGICLGLQLLFESSAEDGATCLGVLGGTVDRLATPGKLPHVGWNAVHRLRPHPLVDGLEDEPMYFVHSYAVAPSDATMVVAETVYGVPFPSMVARDRLVGVQFHPERSGVAGLQLLANFVRFALRIEVATWRGPIAPLPQGKGRGRG